MVRTHARLYAPRIGVALGALFALFAAPALGAPRVRVDFHPQGTVKQVRQVTARFADPVVPLGDPRRAADPFDIVCPESGTARWVDSRTWAYEFTRDLPAGVRCSFRLRPGLKSLGGVPVETRTFAFSTGGPAIATSWPGEGEETIDEEQAFILVLDGEATPESVEQHVSFAVQGITERVGVRLLPAPRATRFSARSMRDRSPARPSSCKRASASRTAPPCAWSGAAVWPRRAAWRPSATRSSRSRRAAPSRHT